TIPAPVKPAFHTAGAFTFVTPHSGAKGTLKGVTAKLKVATSEVSIQRTGLLESIRATSLRAARESTSERLTVATIMFAAQNGWKVMPCAVRNERTPAWVRAACLIRVL